MSDLVGFYLRISYWYEYRATYVSLKETIYTWKIYFQVTASPSSKVWQVVIASTMHCSIWSSAIFKLFFIDAFNWKFVYLFLLASLD